MATPSVAAYGGDQPPADSRIRLPFSFESCEHPASLFPMVAFVVRAKCLSCDGSSRSCGETGGLMYSTAIYSHFRTVALVNVLSDFG